MDASSEQALREKLERQFEGAPRGLIDLVVEQARLLEELRAEIERLRERVAELESSAPRSAAPFRREDNHRSARPKRPGRKAGHEGVFRQRPEQVDEVIEAPLTHCPCCGEPVENATPLEQTIVELPPARAQVTRLITHRARCRRCGREIRSRHPLQTSDAVGAAGTQLGPRAMAAAGVLRHGLGLTLRSSCRALEKLFGLRLSPGGLSQGLDRLAKRVEPQERALKEGLAQAAALHTDETGWYLNNERATLWVFCTPQATLYRVVEHRDRATFHQTAPADYAGVLVSDCLNIYDGETGLQQKCYAHHLRAISQAQEARGQNSPWLESVRSLLETAMELGRERQKGEAADQERRLGALKLAAKVVLEEARRCPHEESVRMRLFKQFDHLFTFLEREGVEPTNNLAERQLRPAVIRRKLSCGNRTRRGARTFEILASLAATCRQTARSFFDLLFNSFQPQAP